MRLSNGAAAALFEWGAAFCLYPVRAVASHTLLRVSSRIL